MLDRNRIPCLSCIGVMPRSARRKSSKRSATTRLEESAKVPLPCRQELTPAECRHPHRKVPFPSSFAPGVEPTLRLRILFRSVIHIWVQSCAFAFSGFCLHSLADWSGRCVLAGPFPFRLSLMAAGHVLRHQTVLPLALCATCPSGDHMLSKALTSEPCIVSERFDGPRLILSQVPWHSVSSAGKITITDILLIGGNRTLRVPHEIGRNSLAMWMQNSVCGKQQQEIPASRLCSPVPLTPILLRVFHLSFLLLIFPAFFSSFRRFFFSSASLAPTRRKMNVSGPQHEHVSRAGGTR
jgi:hypothetical protein